MHIYIYLYTHTHVHLSEEPKDPLFFLNSRLLINLYFYMPLGK
jgi:hypothetical protein